jgi:hypothetical protein
VEGRERSGLRGSERAHFKWRIEMFPGLKFPRQCPLVLLIKVGLREGKAFGSEKGKGVGWGLCYEQRR